MNRYICAECKNVVMDDDTVWVDPDTGNATTGDAGLPYHVACAPSQYLNSPTRRTIKLYKKISKLVGAMRSCEASNLECYNKHKANLIDLVHKYIPLENGMQHRDTFYVLKSTEDKLMFSVSVTRLMKRGIYYACTRHTIKITPSLHSDFNIEVSARNRNDVKDYLLDVFSTALNRDIEDTLN